MSSESALKTPVRSVKRKISLNINGKDYDVEVTPRWTLAELLREELRLTGTKLGCNRAECGVCTVIMDGLPVFSCTVLAVESDGKKIETVESLSQNGGLHPLQQAFMTHDALQCGICTPGMMMSLKYLLETNSSPSGEDVKMAIAGNYCRCGAYPNIISATLEAAQVLKRGK